MNVLLAICIFLPFVAAVFTYFIGKKNTPAGMTVSIITSAVTLALTVYCAVFSSGAVLSVVSFGFKAAGAHGTYAVITAFMWFCAALISPQYFKHHHKVNRYCFFFLITLGSTLGVFLSSDLITTFTFFEIMSFTSYAWVIQEEDKESMAAGKTYLTVAVLGGMVCLMGIFLLWNAVGTLAIDGIYEAVLLSDKKIQIYFASFCMLVGFGAKAGLFPLHIWLPKAHPVAPAPASALLSGMQGE